ALLPRIRDARTVVIIGDRICKCFNPCALLVELRFSHHSVLPWRSCDPAGPFAWTICTRFHARGSSSPLSRTLGARHSRDDEYAILQSHSAKKTDAALGIFRSLAWAPNNKVLAATRGERFNPLS